MAVYCCPKAFSGNYQLLIRRVFGKLTTGKVSVEVITHFNTDTAKTFEKRDPAGQRRGPGQVRPWPMAVARNRSKSSRWSMPRWRPWLKRQFSSPPGDPGPAARGGERPGRGGGPGAAQQAASAASAGQSQQINPFIFPAAWANGLHGAVGYQPIIITLPEGTNMVATAVVSADRRYVRITCVPLFSAVPDVHTFTIDGFNGGNDPEHARRWYGRGGFLRLGRRCRWRWRWRWYSVIADPVKSVLSEGPRQRFRGLSFILTQGQCAHGARFGLGLANQYLSLCCLSLRESHSRSERRHLYPRGLVSFSDP